jgi:hypothetical protein
VVWNLWISRTLTSLSRARTALSRALIRASRARTYVLYITPQFASVRAAAAKLAVTLPKFRVKHCSSPISFFSTTNTNQKHQKSHFHAWLLVKIPLEPPETPALHHHNLHNGWDYQNDGVSVLIPLQHHRHRLLEDLNQPLNQPLNNNQGVQCLQWHHNPDHTIKKMSPS